MCVGYNGVIPKGDPNNKTQHFLPTLTSDDPWPWYMTFDLINKWRNPNCILNPSLLWNWIYGIQYTNLLVKLWVEENSRRDGTLNPIFFQLIARPINFVLDENRIQVLSLSCFRISLEPILWLNKHGFALLQFPLSLHSPSLNLGSQL